MLKAARTTIKKGDYEDNFELPNTKSKPVYDINHASLYIHGEIGIGKSAFAAEFDQAIHLMSEPGDKYLELFRLPKVGQFNNWDGVVKSVDNLLETTRFDNVVFDTAELHYNLVSKKLTSEAGVEYLHEGLLRFGKGAYLAEKLFSDLVLKITGSGRGVVFISHTKSQEFEKAGQVKYTKLVPTIEDRARRFIGGFVDIVGCYCYSGNDRILIIEGSDSVYAKQRMRGRFLTPRGERIIAIPMGNSSEESYENFILAFENKQKESCSDIRQPRLSETKVRFKPRDR
jgi:hypothetical protein